MRTSTDPIKSGFGSGSRGSAAFPWVALLVLMASLAIAHDAMAVTRVWTATDALLPNPPAGALVPGFTDRGNWNHPGNWRSSETVPQPGVPQPGDDVVVGTNHPVRPQLPSSPIAIVNNLSVQGAGVFIYGGSGTIEVRGNVCFFQTNTSLVAENATFILAGSLSMIVTSSNQRFGNVIVQNTNTVGIEWRGAWPNGDAANPLSLTVAANSRITFIGPVNFPNTSVTNNGLIRFAASSPQTVVGREGLELGNVEMVAASTVNPSTLAGPMILRNVTLSGAGSVRMTGTIGIRGNLTETAAGTFTMPNNTAILTIMGTAATPQTISVNPAGAAPRLSVHRLVINPDTVVTMSGTYEARSKGSLFTPEVPGNPGTPEVSAIAFHVKGPTGTPGSVGGRLTLTAGSEIHVGQPGGESVVRIDGRLTTTVGTGATRPTFIGGDTPSTRARMIIGQTAFINVDGLILNRFGANSAAYGLILSDGATIELFDNVWVSESDAVTSIIDLNTGNLPTKEEFAGLELDAAPGGAPKNIDARNVGGFRLSISSGGLNAGGNRYGIAHEIDDNNVLAWDNAPALTIQNSSPLNPPATAKSVFQFSLVGAGGNRPYFWTSPPPAAAPNVLVTMLNPPSAVPPAGPPVLFLNPVTGMISTDPQFRLVNPTAGTPNYDPGQDPVVMPEGNAGGVYQIDIICEDASLPTKVVTRSLTFSVQNAPQPIPDINTFALPDAFEGQAYPDNVVIAAVNSTPTIPYPNNTPGFVFSIAPGSPDPLPAGLTLDPMTGALTGTIAFGAAQAQPSALYRIDFLVTDIFGATDVQRIDIRVFEGVQPLMLGSSAPPNATVGVAYTFKINALNGRPPYSWDLGPGSGELPTGIFLSSSGNVSGTPGFNTQGDYNLVWRVTDSAGSQLTQGVILRVLPPPPPVLTLTPDRAGGGGCTVTSNSNGTMLAILVAGMSFAMLLTRRRALRVEARKS